MYECGDQRSGGRSTRGSDDSASMASVIAFPPTARQSSPSETQPNRLSACLLSLLDAARYDGAVRAVLQPSITWADLIAIARTDPRFAIISANPAFDAAIASALAILTTLRAWPRLDVEVTLAPDQVKFAVCGILAEPVMTPEVADNLTATLQSSGSAEWTLRATDHGILQWHLADEK
jgi:hypothetical protein